MILIVTQNDISSSYSYRFEKQNYPYLIIFHNHSFIELIRIMASISSIQIDNIDDIKFDEELIKNPKCRNRFDMHDCRHFL